MKEAIEKPESSLSLRFKTLELAGESVQSIKQTLSSQVASCLENGVLLKQN